MMMTMMRRTTTMMMLQIEPEAGQTWLHTPPKVETRSRSTSLYPKTLEGLNQCGRRRNPPGS